MSIPETQSRRSSTTTKVFVGNLPANATAKDLKELFTPYGPIAECDIAIRCGFLHLEDKDLALKAIEELNNTTFMGVRISVEKGRVKPPNRSRGGRGGSGGGPMRGGKDRAGPYSRDGFERSPGGRGSYGGRDFPPYGDRYGYDRGGRFDGYDDRRPSFDDRRGGDSFGRPYPNGFDRRPAYDDRPYPAVSGGGYDDRRMPPASAGGYDDRRGSMGADRRPLMDPQMAPAPRPAQSYDRGQPDMYSRRGDTGPKPVDRSVSNYSTPSAGGGYGSPSANAYGSQTGSYGGGYGDSRSSASMGGYDSRGGVQPGAYGDSRAPMSSQGYDTRGSAGAMGGGGGGMYGDSRGGTASSYGAPSMNSYSNTTATAGGYDTYGAARNGSYDAAYPPLPQQRGFASGGGPTPRRDMPPGAGRRY